MHLTALLVRDEKDICLEVYDRGVLTSLADLVRYITPIDKPSDWDIDESESRIVLREVCVYRLPPFPSFISALFPRRRSWRLPPSRSLIELLNET